MSTWNITGVAAAFPNCFPFARLQRLNHDLSFVPSIGASAVRQRKQYRFTAREKLRTVRELAGFHRNDSFGLSAVFRNAQDACRSSANQDLTIRSPACAVRERAIADRDRRATGDRNFLKFVFC